MAARDFSQYFLYRWRYVIGYGTIALLLAGMLLFAGFNLPGGLSQSEIAAVVQSASLSWTDPGTLAISNLPYYGLQAGIFALFGISTFAIKLPSIILAFFTAIGLILLLRRWFTPNIAVLASLIAITTGQFLFISQSGTPSILYVFWPVALLLLGTQVTRAKRYRFLWKILFAIAAALSLYTPLSIYPLIAIALATIFHPHLRAIVRRLKNIRLFAMCAIFLILIAPLVWFIIQNPQLGMTLAGIAQSNWPPAIGDNAMTLLQHYFYFWQPSSGTLMTPVFGLGSALLILLGVYRLILTRDTTRSYLIIFWLICLIPILLLNPEFTSVALVPSVLMLAAGLTSLIGYWYRLFPRNPYARITGLVPIIVLVAALITTGLARYIYGYHYSPEIAPLFSRDLTLLPKDTHELVVTEKQRPFYEAVGQYRKDITVTTTPTARTVVMTRSAHYSGAPAEGYVVTDIITNSHTNDSDRFYILSRTDEK